MDGHQREPLSDETLEREIEAALAVDPSPEFLAKVRARVAREERPVGWPLRWQWAGALVTAAVVLLAVYISRGPETTVDSGPEPVAVVRPDADSLTVTASAIAKTEPEPSSLPVRTITRIARSADVANRPVAPEVLIPEEERRGFQLLLASLRDEKDAKRIGEAVANTEASGPPWLEISPIVIEPFPQFAVFEGDAQ